MTSVLHHVEVSDGTFVDLACGLVGMAERFDALLDRYAPPVASDAPVAEGSPTVDLLLGMIAVRRKLADVLEATVSLDATTKAAELRDEKPGSWLR